MNGLIKVEESENGEPLASARDLHAKLEIEKKFTDWFKYQAEKLGIIEGDDFITFLGSEMEGNWGGQNKIDYLVKIDIAKHICMMSNGKNAKALRQEFIEIEKAWNSPEKVMDRALMYSKMALAKAQEKIKALEPKAEYFDALVDRNLLVNFRDTANELEIKQNDFIAWLTSNGYIYRNSKKEIRAYAEYIPSLFNLKEFPAKNNKWAGVQTMITPKGRETFRLLLKMGKNN
jgi:anti-repressor protein